MRSCTLATATVATTLLFGGCAESPAEPASGPGPLQFALAVPEGPHAACEAELPIEVTVTGTGGRPIRDLAINFNVVEGGGSVFAGTALTDQLGRARDHWTIGSAPGQSNTLAVRTVDPVTGEAITHGTATLRTRSEILFARLEGLYRWEEDGSVAALATGEFLFPAWSPDGERIAFVREREVDHISNHEIYIMNADGSGTPQCISASCGETPTLQQDLFPTWSPDGEKILFSRGTAPAEVWVMNADGSNPQRLETGESPVWSPDGSEIAFMKFTVATGTWTLHVMNADGSGVVQLSYGTDHERRPVWSPDGEEIAFSRSGVGIVVVKRDAATISRTLPVGSPVAWSADGRRILFQSLDHANPGRPLFGTVDVATGETRILWIADAGTGQELSLGTQGWRGCMP